MAVWRQDLANSQRRRLIGPVDSGIGGGGGFGFSASGWTWRRQVGRGDCSSHKGFRSSPVIGIETGSRFERLLDQDPAGMGIAQSGVSTCGWQSVGRLYPIVQVVAVLARRFTALQVAAAHIELGLDGHDFGTRTEAR